MDTAENELQALRKEFDTLREENFALYKDLSTQNELLLEQIITLRQENIALCKELAKQHVTLDNKIKLFGGGFEFNSIEIFSRRLAVMQTAEFINNNMPKLKTFADRGTSLRYHLTQISTAPCVCGGLYLEFGVFQGKSINLISSTLPDKIIYGFDSFEGLPETWWREDKYPKGHFSLEGNLPQVNENVRLIKGWFNETLPDFVKEHPEPCAFIHIDCDIYSSTKTVLDILRNQIVSGTIIVFDEYFNYPGWQEGEYKAFMEFVKWSDIKFEYIARTNGGQVVVRIK